MKRIPAAVEHERSPRSHGGVRSALLFAQTPNLPTKQAGGRRRSFFGGPGGRGGRAPPGRLLMITAYQLYA
eukprot:10605581-Alexandrium_andersonii.AAC.1